MKASQEQLRDCQWIETTTVAVNGELQSQEQKRGYYGVDGKLEKVIESQTPDGTIYAEKSVLAASSENLTVTVENAGYRRVAG